MRRAQRLLSQIGPCNRELQNLEWVTGMQRTSPPARGWGQGWGQGQSQVLWKQDLPSREGAQRCLLEKMTPCRLSGKPSRGLRGGCHGESNAAPALEEPRVRGVRQAVWPFLLTLQNMQVEAALGWKLRLWMCRLFWSCKPRSLYINHFSALPLSPLSSLLWASAELRMAPCTAGPVRRLCTHDP